MIEVTIGRAWVPDLAQEVSTLDRSVHEGLTSVRGLAPYLEKPWRERVELGRFQHYYPCMISFRTTDMASENEVLTSLSHGLTNEQHLSTNNVVGAVSGYSFLQRSPKRSSRKTCHPAYTTSDHSRCK